MAHELYDLRETKAGLEEQVKEINKRLKALTEKEIPEEMDNRELTKFSVAGLGTIYTQAEVYANVKADDRPALYEWLREGGHGELVKDWVFPQSLKAFVKERLENGETFPEFIGATVIETARLRKG
jgi:hypothetical protein